MEGTLVFHSTMMVVEFAKRADKFTIERGTGRAMLAGLLIMDLLPEAS